jgi:hypothetical protein
MGERAKKEGSSFGANRSGDACLDEGLRGVNASDGLGCQVESRLFLEHCLKAAAPAQSLASMGPRPKKILQTAQW